MNERTSKGSTKSSLKNIPTKGTTKTVAKSPKKNMGGSIVSFIVVGVILLIGLGGGVYYLANRGDNNSAPTSEVSQDPATETQGAQDKEQATPAPAQPEKATEAAPQPAATPQAPAATAPSEIVQTGPSRPAPAELPRTGAGETLVGLLGTAVFSFAAIAYFRSLRISPVTQE